MQSELWTDIRDDLRGLFVGDRTLGDSFLAPIVFIAINAFYSLGWAAVAAGLVGILVAGWRVRKGQEVSYALGGIGAIVFAGVLAFRSGRAETFFLPGILSAAFMSFVAFASLIVRRPLSAWSSHFYRQWPRAWYWRPDVRPAYTTATIMWAAYFGGRAALQGWFYVAEQPELLAAAKLATSWPLLIPLFIVSYAVGNRKLHALGGPNVEEFLADAQAPFTGKQRGF